MIYEQNDSLRVSTEPRITLTQVIQTESKQNLTEQLPCDSLDGGPPGQYLV